MTEPGDKIYGLLRQYQEDADLRNSELIQFVRSALARISGGSEDWNGPSERQRLYALIGRLSLEVEALTTNAARRNDAPHKVMTGEEYMTTAIEGWHRVCRNVDGTGNVGVQFDGQDR